MWIVSSKNFKGSYTVEAAYIFSFSFIIVGMAICTAFDLFIDAIDYVSFKQNDYDAVSLFRLKEGVVGVIHAIKD